MKINMSKITKFFSENKKNITLLMGLGVILIFLFLFSESVYAQTCASVGGFCSTGLQCVDVYSGSCYETPFECTACCCIPSGPVPTACEPWDVFCIIREFFTYIASIPFRLILAGATLVLGLFGIIAGGILSIIIIIANFFINLSIAVGVTPANPNTPEIVRIGWAFSRDFVNILFLLILAFIGLATILKLETYGAKRTLPLLLIIALLVNFSPVLVGLVVDVGNILTYFFRTQAASLEAENLPINTGINYLTTQITTLFAVPTDRLLEFALGSLVYGVVFILFCGVAALVYLALALLFFFRIIALWILVILAPFAFACYILPATRRGWDTWWRQLILWSMIGVPIGLFLYFSNYVMEAQQEVLTAMGVSTSTLAAEISKGGTLAQAVAPLIAAMLAPFLALALLGVGIVISMQFVPAGASQIIDYGKKAGLVAAGWTLRGMKEAGKRVAPGTEKWGERLRRFGEITPERKGVALLTAVPRWGIRRIGAGMEITGREIAGRVRVSEEKEAREAAQKISRMAPEQVQNLLTKEGRAIAALRWGITPGIIQEEAVLNLIERKKLEEAIKKGLIKKEEIFGIGETFKKKERLGDAVLVASQFNEKGEGFRRLFPEKAAEMDRLELEAKEKRREARTFFAQKKYEESYKVDMEAEKLEEETEKHRMDIFAMIKKIPIDKIGKMGEEFLTSTAGKKAVVDIFDAQRMGEIARNFGRDVVDTIQREINSRGLLELARTNPGLTFWLSTGAAQTIGFRLPESAGAISRRDLRDIIRNVRVQGETRRENQINILKRDYLGREQTMFRDYYRKETPEEIKGLIKSIVTEAGKTIPLETEVKRVIEKYEKPLQEMNKEMLENWKEYQRHIEAYEKAGRPTTGPIYSAWRAARDAFERLKKDVEQERSRLEKAEETELRRRFPW